MKQTTFIGIAGLAILLLTSSLTVFGQPPKKERGLVLYLPLNPTTSTVKDMSGQKNNGQPAGIVVSNSPSLISMQETRQLTISVWIKPDSIPREFPVIVGLGGNQSPGAYGGYELVLNFNGDNDIGFASGSCYLDTHGANGKWVNSHLGEWIHVAFTLNDQTKTAKFYINGYATNDEYDYDTFFNATSRLNFNLPNNLYVGIPDPAHNANRARFDGSIRELMIFNRELTAVEIQKIYNTTHPQIIGDQGL